MEFSEIVKAIGFDKTANPASAVAPASVRADPDDDRPWSRRGQPIITRRETGLLQIQTEMPPS